MTGKAKRAQYTVEFKLEAVRLVKAGQSMAAVAATLGVVEQTLYNRVKAVLEATASAAPMGGLERRLDYWRRLPRRATTGRQASICPGVFGREQTDYPHRLFQQDYQPGTAAWI